MLKPVHWLLSFIASVLRLGAGAAASPVNTAEPVILYEFEGCPFCRIAREAISEAGLAVLVRPCPKAGKRFRPQVKEQGGKAQFPYLVDPNANLRMYESADIAAHIRKNYGTKSRPFIHWLGPLNLMASSLGVMIRLVAGTFAKKSRAPDKPLEFYGAERHPGARLVKELLCEMELPYYWRSQAPEEKAAPYLFDPNCGQEASGAAAIRRYLRDAYRP